MVKMSTCRCPYSGPAPEHVHWDVCVDTVDGRRGILGIRNVCVDGMYARGFNRSKTIRSHLAVCTGICPNNLYLFIRYI